MKSIHSVAVALLAVVATAPAFAQQSQEFFGRVCEIDTSVLNVVPSYKAPDETTSVITFDSTKLCTGVASKRNIKLVCRTPLPGWGTRPDKTARKFPCTINPDQCGLTPKPGDTVNAPYVTTRDSVLKVTGGVAELICHYKP